MSKPFARLAETLPRGAVDAAKARMTHPALMSSQERISLANALDRMAENPTDCFDPDKLKLAANVLHYQEARLTMVRAAVA